MATSYNGWPASRFPNVIGINSKWAPLGHPFPGGIKGGDVETIFTYLVHQLHARVEPIEWYAPGDEWGYNYRANVNNPNSLSCHASGTAIDYNATRHPNGRRGTFTAAQVRQIREIQKELDGVIRWGGDFSGTPDEMHFEINASAAKVAEVARRLRLPPAPSPSPPPTGDPDMYAAILNRITSLYQAAGRGLPDPAGLAFWYSQYVAVAGNSLQSLAIDQELRRGLGLPV